MAECRVADAVRSGSPWLSVGAGQVLDRPSALSARTRTKPSLGKPDSGGADCVATNRILAQVSSLISMD